MSLTLDSAPLSAAEVGERGREIYFNEIQSQDHNGEYLTIEILSHDWEVGKKHRETLFAMRDRYPSGELYTLKVGEIVIGHAGSAGS
ncbi:hypothetical protein [Armatimonas sp.]|uniref:hypothetical protein n=1 Tax=Armatimonas sp. TaxID=1872638 RepID=UPI00286D507D|nr:hypothetical protein [Armatimonas sp.]